MKLLDGVDKLVVKYFVDHMKAVQKVHFDSTNPMDTYFTGMYNGMEVLIASVQGTPGEFKKAEQIAFDEAKPL